MQPLSHNILVLPLHHSESVLKARVLLLQAQGSLQVSKLLKLMAVGGGGGGRKGREGRRRGGKGGEEGGEEREGRRRSEVPAMPTQRASCKGFNCWAG